MVREEGKRDKMRTRLGKRAMGYEEKLERGEGSEWARRCWEEIKKRGEERGSRWEEQRKEFYRIRGVSVEWVKRSREEGREIRGEIEEGDREVQRSRKDTIGYKGQGGIDGIKR